MTTQVLIPRGERAAAAPSSSAQFSRLLAMEWTKLRTVRSTAFSFAVFAVLSFGLSVLFTSLSVHTWDKIGADKQAGYRLDAVGQFLGGGFFLGQLSICVLAVLAITGEYSTGMISSSLLAAPARTPLLLAKGVVFAALTFVVAEAVAFGTFLADASILHGKVPVALGDPGVPRALVGGGLYLAVLGLFAMAIGALVRHTAGSVTGVLGFVLVLAPLAQLLPGRVGKHVHAYLPTEAGHLITQAHQASGDLLSPTQGFGVFCLWTVALWAAALYLLRRRDA
jgi:ABC-2 type transport system permease protein